MMFGNLEIGERGVNIDQDPVRRPTWTECDGGWSLDLYRIESPVPGLWVLSITAGDAAVLLHTADSPTELEAFQAIHARAGGWIRPVLMLAIWVLAISGLVVGSIVGSLLGFLFVSVAAIVSIATLVDLSEFVVGRRTIRTHISV